MFIIVNDNHMKKLLLCIFTMFTVVAAYSQTSLEGKVTEKDSKEPVIFGTVAIYKNGVLITGTDTDIDGNYFLGNLEPGTYDVEFKYLGFADMKQTGVLLKASQTTRLNVEMVQGGVVLDDIVVIEYRAPLVDVDNTSTGTTLSAEKIASLGVKSINSIVATSAGVSSQDGEEPSIRGSRSNETVYFIDGIRSFGTIPQSEVDQLQILTGGIEAKYGDVTGGVISLTSKGPSEKFSGGVDLETSQFLDAFGYNLLSANFSGPILKNKKGQSLLGFRVSGQYLDIDDANPSAIGVYRAPESVIKELESNVFSQQGQFTINNGESLTDEQIGGALDARPNNTSANYNLTGKIDGRLNDNIDISLSGNYIKTDNQFTPGNNNIDQNPWYMFNWTNNPFSDDTRYRLNFRFRHKLGNQSYGGTPDENEKPSNIQNLQYTIQAGFERNTEKRQDARHEGRLGNYGYVGVTPTNFEPQFGQGPAIIDGAPDPEIFENRHLGYNPVEGEFIADQNINPVLATYNQQNGFLRTDRSAIWNNLFANVGQVYNNFRRQQDDLFTLNLSTGFDFLPGGSEKGRHSIQFGVLYEQRVNRRFTATPFQLWRLGETLVNNHINGLNFDKIIGTEIVGSEILGFDTLNIYAPAVNTDANDKFYFEIRERLGGVAIDEYVNLSALDPSLMTLDLFSPQELIDNGRVSYYGYDYLGNITTENTSFEDFFTARGEDGRRAFPVAPFTPIYGAAWVQDKFSYKDIIFRLGLRMDYYDANTKVLKDPYALYEIETANDFFSRTGQPRPESVGDSYKVYVDGDDSDKIVGYREGDNWFDASGTQVSNGNDIFNGGIVFPAYKGRDQRVLDIRDPDFDTNTSFDDYKPQINWMPRLSFSFPISEDAGFFANYDILYSRPPSNSLQTALNFYNFENAGSAGVLNNSNLKPVRTTNYEIGFQQKVSQTTALKISAYYREIKDLIQRRAFANIPSPINNYEAFDNLDFGTTKGFTFQFDRRRTSNLELSATYTLQFAEGSGSDANSSSGINTRGPIRSLVPLSFDERHRFTANVDYRYQSGKGYDGPKIAGIDIFANAGVNFTAIAVSGQPFTQRARPTQFGGSGFVGSINGNRQPWTFNIDMRIDKRFTFKASETARPLSANVYFRVQNLLNTRNVGGVYSFTGDPDDDGFLASSFGAARLNSIIENGGNVNSFLDSYGWRLNSGGNYLRPRRMYLGVIFNF